MLYNCKISDYKIKKILKHFCEDLEATKTAKLLRINRRTINRYFNIFREKIVLFSLEICRESGEFEVDESYFGAKRMRGKTPVFGLLKRDEKVYVTVVKILLCQLYKEKSWKGGQFILMAGKPIWDYFEWI